MPYANKTLDEVFPFVTRLSKPEIPTVGREKEVGEALDILYKTRMRNLIVLGPAGVGKTHLVREVALRAKQHVFYEISASSLVAGQKYVGDFEKRIETVIGQAQYENNHSSYEVVLFFDEVHTMVGCGSNKGDRYEMDLAQILKPILSKNILAIWGATTRSEYEASIAPDRALRRRFDTIELAPLSEEDVLETLRRFCYGSLPDETLRTIMKEAGPVLPDSAITRIDHMLAHQRRIAALGEGTDKEAASSDGEGDETRQFITTFTCVDTENGPRIRTRKVSSASHRKTGAKNPTDTKK